MQSIKAESETPPPPLQSPSSEVDQTVNRRCPHRTFIWNPVYLYTKDHDIYNYTNGRPHHPAGDRMEAQVLSPLQGMWRC